MGNNLTLGKLFGIEISFNWSLIIIFGLLTWSLAAGVFPALHPDWSPLLNWGTAFAAAVLFFISLLAHELAHSLVAKAQGITVRSITLWLFGGVSNIQEEPSSARNEFLIAVVGPLTSIVLGVIFLFAAGLGTGEMIDPGQAFAQIGPVRTLLFWLGPINILLGIFNLLPGFPLDGGRILRAILWGATGNLRKATRWASWVGQGFGWLLVLMGIAMVLGVQFPILGTGLFNGLWLAFIGWFLRNAAIQSYQQLVIQDVLKNVPVSSLMDPNVPTIPPGTTVAALVHDYFMKSNARAFPVVQDGQVAGLVCLEDVRKVPQDAWQDTTALQVMTPADRLTMAAPDEEASQALTDLASNDVDQVPVVQDGRLVGMLRRRDILRWLQIHSERATG